MLAPLLLLPLSARLQYGLVHIMQSSVNYSSINHKCNHFHRSLTLRSHKSSQDTSGISALQQMSDVHAVSIKQHRGGQLYQLSNKGHRLQLYTHYFDLLSEGGVSREGEVKEQSEVISDAYQSVRKAGGHFWLLCTRAVGIPPEPSALGQH